MLSSKEILDRYISFFKSRGHEHIESAPLISKEDKSALFNIAGMQPLKPYLLGKSHPKGTRLVNAQRCVRTKDIDEVGDDTHLTSFLMLGNWSLGDYFKKESIEWSYELLTNKDWFGLDRNYLAVSVYKGDSNVPKDEKAYNLWKERGVAKDRIKYLGAKDNWWKLGERGPCGPDTEIFYWTGEDNPPKEFNPEDERWLEVWNNVFMTYNRLNENTLVPLEKKNIDTGMGFERIVSVVQKKESFYETDLFLSIIQEISQKSVKDYDKYKREFRIIADHIRSAVFLLNERLKPSNKDQGYVLRRLIRRGITYGRKIGLELFTKDLALNVINSYKGMFEELVDSKLFILEEIEKEEVRFRATLTKGLNKFEKMAKENISGKDAFLLFQSFGFPIELTEELAKERGIKVDIYGFRDEFEKHQNASKKGSEKKFKSGLADTSKDTTRMHTAVHLLLSAMQKLVSAEIKQRGSNINSERIRFDFSFDRKLTPEEIEKIENYVNKIVYENVPVVREEMKLEDAYKAGAQGEFGFKYPEVVSVYTIDKYSKEICTGPHVDNTKEIGYIKIGKQKSVGAGVRRIKASLV